MVTARVGVVHVSAGVCEQDDTGLCECRGRRRFFRRRPL